MDQFNLILNLLEKSFLSNNNDEIKAATSQLESYYNDPGFLTCLFHIIVYEHELLHPAVRKAAAIQLRIIIHFNWSELSEESHQMILSTFPSILTSVNFELFKYILVIGFRLIELTIPNGEWDILPTIYQGFQTSGKTFLSSLGMSKCLSKYFTKEEKFYSQSDNALFNTFVNNIVPFLSHVISTSQDFFQVGICYKIIGNISKRFADQKIVPPFFEQNTELFGQWCSKAIEFGKPENLLINPTEEDSEYKSLTPDFFHFAHHSIHFLTFYMYYFPDFLPDDYILSALNSFTLFLSIPVMSSKTLGIVFCLFKEFLNHHTSWALLLGNLDTLLQGIVMNYFMQFYEEDFQLSIEDPNEFLLKFFGESASPEDPFAYLKLIISKKCRDSPEMTGAIINMIGSYLSSTEVSETPWNCFCSLSLLSIALIYAPIHHPQLIDAIVPLLTQILGTNNHLNKVGALICFSKLPLVSIEILDMIIANLIDESPYFPKIVTYFAANTFSDLIQKGNPEYKQSIRTRFAPNLPTIIIMILNIYNIFGDPDLFVLVSTIVSFFGIENLTFGIPLVMQLFHQYITIVSMNKKEFLLNTIVSLISIISQNEEMMKEIGHSLLSEIFTILTELFQKPQQLSENYFEIIESLLNFAAHIIKCLPPVPEIWGFVSQIISLPPQFLNQTCFVLYEAILKGNGTQGDVQTIFAYALNALQSITTSYDFKSYEIQGIVDLLEALIVKFSTMPGITESFPILLSISQNWIQQTDLKYTRYAPQIIGSLLYSNAEAVFDIVGDDRNALLATFFNTAEFENMAAFALRYFDKLTKDQVYQFFSEGMELLNERAKKLIENEEILAKMKLSTLNNSLDFSSSIEKSSVYDSKGLVSQFKEFLYQYSKQNAEGFQEINSQYDDPSITSILDIIIQKSNN